MHEIKYLKEYKLACWNCHPIHRELNALSSRLSRREIKHKPEIVPEANA
jgi:hypothetical protein